MILFWTNKSFQIISISFTESAFRKKRWPQIKNIVCVRLMILSFHILSKSKKKKLYFFFSLLICFIIWKIFSSLFVSFVFYFSLIILLPSIKLKWKYFSGSFFFLPFFLDLLIFMRKKNRKKKLKKKKKFVLIKPHDW